MTDQPHAHAPPHRLRRLLIPVKPPPPISPELLRHTEKRAEDTQNRIADAITTFAGSMTFVYIHVIRFGC